MVGALLAMKHPSLDPADDLRRLFPGEEEMARLCRAHDWGRTPLGPTVNWSAQLRTTVTTLLGVRFPMLVVWGPEYVMLYNDAYRVLMGPRHPGGLGQRNADCWPEFWDINEPIFGRALAGETVTLEDACYPIDRDGSGVLRDSYFSLSWSPVPGADGLPGGVCIVALETTDQLLGRTLQAERERVLAAERAARQRIERLQAFTAALSAAVSEMDVARAVLREGIPAVGAAAGAVLRFAPDDPGALEIVWSEGFDVPELAPWQRFPLTRPSPITDAVRDGEPVWIDGPSGMGARYPDLVALADATGFGGWIAVPFMVRDENAPQRVRTLGGFGVAFRGTHETDTDERALLLALARQSAQALARARAYEEATATRKAAEAARRRSDRLRDVMSALSGATDALAVFDVLVTEARLSIGAHACAVALLDAEETELRFVRWFGYPDDVMGEWLRVPLEAPLPLTDAVRSQAPLWVPTREAMAEGWPHFVEAAQAAPSESWAVLPLVASTKQAVGALALSFPEPLAADPELLAFAEALVGHCAQALERARLYDAEHTARAEAELANRAKSQFLSVLSHELRTPLNAIAGYAELLSLGIRGPVTEGQQKDLLRLRRANDHMIGLVNTILEFAQMEAGHISLNMDDVALRPLLADVHAIVAPQAGGKGVQLEIDGWGASVESAETIVRADAEKLRQILVNLLGNALKFTEPQGQVRVSVEVDASPTHVCVLVRDTGRGIAPEELERIFDPFVQLDRHRTPDSQQGVGLGLTISRDLARDMDGALTVESMVGHGSTFRLRLARAGV